MYLISTATRPPRPDNDFFDRPGQYQKTLYNPKGMHVGNDIPCALKTPVRAFRPGKVIFAGFLKGLGYTVVIRDRYGRCWGSAHLYQVKVQKGQKVRRRKIIGLAGASGNTNGVHVHHFGTENADWLDKGWGQSPYFNTWPYLMDAWRKEWA